MPRAGASLRLDLCPRIPRVEAITITPARLLNSTVFRRAAGRSPRACSPRTYDRQGAGFPMRGRVMRAIRVHESGGIDTMRLDEIPRPVPGAGEVLVAVKAAGVGPWDRLVREGQSGLGQALPLTLGADVIAKESGASVYGTARVRDVERGMLNLPIGDVLDLADASTAHRMLDGAPHNPAKIVLKVAD